eukprot:605370-Pelagomonas_calceolata.AAC.7
MMLAHHDIVRTRTGVSLGTANLRSSTLMGSRVASTRASTAPWAASRLDKAVPFLMANWVEDSDLRCGAHEESRRGKCHY